MISRRFIFRAAAALLVLLACAWFARAHLLASLASLWIIDNPPAKADAIFVLGGGEQFRPLRAAELYHAGVAPNILIARQPQRTTDVLHITPAVEEMSRQILISKGIPESAIHLIGDSVTSTMDEALCAARWMKDHNAKALVLPTDMFHTRRTHWIFNRELNPIGAKAHTTTSLTGDYVPENWWHSEHGLLHFQNEVFKYLLYLWRYS